MSVFCILVREILTNLLGRIFGHIFAGVLVQIFDRFFVQIFARIFVKANNIGIISTYDETKEMSSSASNP